MTTANDIPPPTFGPPRPVRSALASALLVAAVHLTTPAVSGQEPMPSDVVESVVVLPHQLQRDGAGRPIVDTLPFVRPQREARAGDAAEIESLKDERDRVTGSARAARALIALPEPRADQLQNEIDAAKRMR